MAHSRNSLIKQSIDRAIVNAEHQCSNIAGALEVVNQYLETAQNGGQIITDEHLQLGEAINLLLGASEDNLKHLTLFKEALGG